MPMSKPPLAATVNFRNWRRSMTGAFIGHLPSRASLRLLPRRDEWRDARARCFAINVHGAGAAQRHAAAIFGAGQPKMVAQDPEERSGRVGIYFHRLAIHGEAGHESLLAAA